MLYSFFGRNDYASTRNSSKRVVRQGYVDTVRRKTTAEVERLIGKTTGAKKGLAKALREFLKYEPNQPRDPGGEGGGQWIAASAGRDRVNPDDIPTDEEIAKIKQMLADGTSPDEMLAAMGKANEVANGNHLITGNGFG